MYVAMYIRYDGDYVHAYIQKHNDWELRVSNVLGQIPAQTKQILKMSSY